MLPVHDVVVFNWQVLLLGGLVMLACLAVQAAFVVTVMTVAKARIRALMAAREKMKAQAVFFIGILVLLMSHLAQIYIWGMTLYLAGLLANVHSAIIFAGSTYTTIGFAANLLPLQWQMLLVIMAVSGVFSFGWSTSIMFSLSRFLYSVED
jgi:hypothetical protein